MVVRETRCWQAGVTPPHFSRVSVGLSMHAMRVSSAVAASTSLTLAVPRKLPDKLHQVSNRGIVRQQVQHPQQAQAAAAAAAYSMSCSV